MKKTILVSDLTGEEINGNGAKVTVVTQDATFVLDVLVSEVADLLEHGRKQKKRGRKAAAQTA